MKKKKEVRVDRKGSDFLIGRENEVFQIRACLQAKRNVLLEGAVGVGKTFVALSVTAEMGLPVFRVDGDNRYSEQKLTGWFDPPTVLKKGYHSDAFIPGPLVEAMQAGGILFINELNRLPEGVQNVLLPAIDERILIVPRLGVIQANANFCVIATQNPKEFVATSHLSEAILDRFELIHLDYQSEEEEQKIVTRKLQEQGWIPEKLPFLPLAAVQLVRLTRGHSRVRRGASIRAAMSVAELTHSLIQAKLNTQGGKSLGFPEIFPEAFLSAALIGLPTRIEVERNLDIKKTLRSDLGDLIREWVQTVLSGLPVSTGDVKKKN